MRSRKRNIYESTGNLYFVTSTVVGFVQLFQIKELADILINNLAFYQNRGDFTILAYVIMPNHFHLILKVSKKTTISKVIGNLKRITSRQISKKLLELNRNDLIQRLKDKAKEEPTNDSKIWKYRFDCLVINNLETLKQKIKYIHNNPVKKQFVENPVEWKFSSALNYAGNAECLMDIDTEWKCLEDN